MSARRLTATLLGVGALLAATACVPQVELPSDCDATQVERGVALEDQGLDPVQIDVCRDQRVTLNVTTQRDGVLHLHGYDDQGAAIETRVGETAHLVFTASRPGQFEIEFHDVRGSSEEIGILTVHEP